MPRRGIRGRGQGRGQRRGRGRGIPIANNIENDIPVMQGQESHYSSATGSHPEVQQENPGRREEQDQVPERAQAATVVNAGVVLQQLADLLTNGGNGGVRADPPSRPQTGPDMLEKFRKLKPPTYDGTPDIEAAERFLIECEKILIAMEITDHSTRINLTTFQLVGRAGSWWSSLRNFRGATELTWEEFKERFRDQFFPQSLRDAKREEFANLIQGSMTVLEYERRFSDLSEFAPELVSTTRLKCRRFERGLRPALRGRIVPLGLDDYEALINRAMTVDRDMTETRSIQEGRQNRNSILQGIANKKRPREGILPPPPPSSYPQPGRVAPSQSKTPVRVPPGQVFCYTCRQP